MEVVIAFRKDLLNILNDHRFLGLIGQLDLFIFIHTVEGRSWFCQLPVVLDLLVVFLFIVGDLELRDGLQSLCYIAVDLSS